MNHPRKTMANVWHAAAERAPSAPVESLAELTEDVWDWRYTIPAEVVEAEREREIELSQR